MLYNIFLHCKITKYNRLTSIQNTKILSLLSHRRLNNVNGRSFLPHIRHFDINKQNDAISSVLLFFDSIFTIIMSQMP